MPSNTMNAAVLGSGLLGLDLVERMHNSPRLSCGLVVGRTSRSRGLAQAAELGCATAAGGVAALLDSGQTFDIVFDATNAFEHPEHWARLAGTGAVLIDLTPTSAGALIAPTVNGDQAARHQHIGLISCGGQASIPVLYALAQHYRPRYVEMVATAASVSVGRASRLNLDEYVETTQDAIRRFTGTSAAKAMLNISAAAPPPPFRIAMTMVASGLEQGPVSDVVECAAAAMRTVVPGYQVTSCTVTGDTVRVIAEVTATRNRMPVHAGNLEVISAAAIHAAEQHALVKAPALKELAR
ncbi:acetylating acetaldehyde dehydrogenase [Streptomyces actinomycinicus]|uniref:Acetaldehyde dehydrogenase n=1 Tax=Streptomyces actinomycinicus TaxID=1695166 RepID=A0A937JTJ2_9ACTN|nr:acetylating acetaldehyde dehydrogenase [Streptomyces actinomycinicus]MBL1086833.1 acetylating acetaldehyde dehydrogenase [Streptomyces actinomycinicus]